LSVWRRVSSVWLPFRQYEPEICGRVHQDLIVETIPLTG
jgi:hypothetical protein